MRYLLGVDFGGGSSFTGPAQALLIPYRDIPVNP